MILSVIMSRNLLIFEAKIRRFWLSRPSKLPQMDQDPPLKLSIFDFKIHRFLDEFLEAFSIRLEQRDYVKIQLPPRREHDF